MVANRRNYYAPEFKVKVLDECRVKGEVAAVARLRKLDPGLLYSWKANEADIRKAAKAEERLHEGLRKRPWMRQDQPPAPAPAPAPAESKPTEPILDDGPRLTVHALGPWLRMALRSELPGVLEATVEKVVRRLMSEKIGELVRDELAAAFTRKAPNGSGEAKG